MEFNPYSLPKNQPRADFRPEVFRKFVFNHGLRCTWEQAARCPCWQPSASVAKGLGVSNTVGNRTGQWRKDCPLCSGKGWFHHSPTPTIALFTSGADNPAILAMGEAGRGVTAITCLPENLPAYKDRFTLKDSIVIMREGRTRGPETVEALRYPVALRQMSLEEGDFEIGVLYAHKASSEGLAVVDGELKAGEAFEITEDGRLDWTVGDQSGKAPANGEYYTVSYYHHPRFLVDNIPHGWRDTRVTFKHPESALVPMPVHVMAKLEHLGEGGVDG